MAVQVQSVTVVAHEAVMLYFKDAGDVLQSAVLTGWAMHVSILAKEDAVKGSATRAAML